MSAALRRRLRALEVAIDTKANEIEIVGFQVTSYENWPDPVPADWRETFPGSELWLTPE